MSILKNAIDSIALGLEDYEFSESDERRIISCTRNIYAGILLLFKHQLSSIDEALIWIGDKRKNTIKPDGIKKKFEELGITVEWNRIENIKKYRNDTEHYFSVLEHKAVQGLISNSFIIIRDFISEQLQQDPKELLGDESWATLVEINEVYEKEKEDCNSSIETLTFFSETILNALLSYSCSQCGSDLIYSNQRDIDATDADFVCKSCDAEYTYQDIIQSAIADYFQHEIYDAQKDGIDDYIVTDCPFCGGIYLYEEKVCAECGDSANHECDLDGEKIAPSELTDGNFCSYHAHIMSKDD